MKTYFRKEVALLSGFSIDTLRYYEREKLVIPERNDKNYRLYNDNHLELLKFILSAKKFDFTLQEIKHLSQLRRAGQLSEIHSILQERIDEISTEIDHLKATQQNLEILLKNIKNGKCSSC